MKNRNTLLIPLLAVAGLTGCLSIEAPKDFLLIEESASELKLITPDESKLWVRELNDPDQGELRFWCEALETDLVERRGYTLIESNDTTDAAGRTGKEWVLEATVDGLARRYLISILVIEGSLSNTIRVTEYLAPKTQFDDRLADVRAAIATVAP